MLLSTDIWVAALIKRAEMAGAFATIARRGERQFGSVIVKVLNLKTRDSYLLREAQQGDETVWMRPLETRDEASLDAYIARQLTYDPDLWLVDIEDGDGRHFLTEKVVET